MWKKSRRDEASPAILEKRDVDRNQEGIQAMQVLGQNMAWQMKKLYG